MNYRTMSKRNLILKFAELRTPEEKIKMGMYFMSKHKVGEDEKSPFEMMGKEAQAFLNSMWFEEAVKNPTGVISVELMKRAPESKKRAQLQVGGNVAVNHSLKVAQQMLNDASHEEMAAIVQKRINGNRPVLSLEEAKYTEIES
jgi:hypothetical protein